MKFVVFDDYRVGTISSDSITDLTTIVDQINAGTQESRPLRAIAAWTDVTRVAASNTVPPAIGLDQVRLVAPVPRPGKVVAAPLNYVDHNREMGQTSSMAELGVFLKANSSVVGPGATIALPFTDRRTDQEGELGVVIGRRTRGVPAKEALSRVFGYTCLLDITVRGDEDRSTRKSFDTFTPIGPWIVTADEVPDPDSLHLRCWVNGVLRQDANTRDLIFSVAETIAYASSIMTLEPGDVIATGTPAGVGPLTNDDLVEVELEQIGRLAVTVSAAAAVPWKDKRLRAMRS